MPGEAALVVLLALPFAGSVAAMLLPRSARGAGAWVAGGTALAATLITLSRYDAIQQGEILRFSVPWLPAGDLYQPLSYVQALSHLLAVIGQPVHWVGTSLGGLTGMVLAASANTPIRRMVINDIGPFLPWAPIRHIGSRLRDAPRLHHNLASGESRLRTVLAAFGPLTDEQWRHIAKHSFFPEIYGASIASRGVSIGTRSSGRSRVTS